MATGISQRINSRIDLAFVKLVPNGDLAIDASRPVLIANGSRNIKAIAESEDIGDLVDGEPRVACKSPLMKAE